MNKMRIANTDIVTHDVFQTVIENFPDMIHSVDEQGNIIITNKTAEKLLGYTRGELLSMNIVELYPEELREAVRTGFYSLKKAGETSVESEVVAKDGSRIPVEIRSFSIYDDDGNFDRTFSILRDIREIKALQEGLIHTERLAAIGELASGIVHDVNNPLSVIRVCIDLIQDTLKSMANREDPKISETEEYIQDIDRASKSIEKLVRHLRNFSRGIAEKPEAIDIGHSLGEAQFLLQSKTKQLRVKVEVEVPLETYYTFGSPNKIEQVFANLISNAADAMEKSQERQITISVTADTREGKDYWRCDVRDTGEGIPKEKQKYIFNSFFTTKEKGKGTGLGLSIARGILKDHQGDIIVNSEVGKGTTFSVYLLQAEKDTAANI